MKKTEYKEAVIEVVEFETEDIMNTFQDSRDNTSDDQDNDGFDDEEGWGV